VNTVVFSTVSLALAVYLSVAVSGVVTYGTKLRPDVLVNYPDDSGWFLAARAVMSAVVLCAYPLQAHPSRKCALSLLRAACAAYRRHCGRCAPTVGEEGFDEEARERLAPAARNEEGKQLASLLPLEREPGQAESGFPGPVKSGDCSSADEDYSLRYWLFTALFIVCSWRIASSVDNLGKVMAVVGATGSTCVSYILPGAIYIRLHPQPHAKRHVAQLMLCAGLLIAPIALHAIFTR
jgi:amino acid permease